MTIDINPETPQFSTKVYISELAQPSSDTPDKVANQSSSLPADEVNISNEGKAKSLEVDTR